MTKKELLRKYNGHVAELRKIINAFDLMPGAPSSEFDKLVHKILNELNKEADKQKIISILKSELVITYGFYENEFDATAIADRVIQWWNSKM